MDIYCGVGRGAVGREGWAFGRGRAVIAAEPVSMGRAESFVLPSPPTPALTKEGALFPACAICADCVIWLLLLMLGASMGRKNDFKREKQRKRGKEERGEELGQRERRAFLHSSYLLLTGPTNFALISIIQMSLFCQNR